MSELQEKMDKTSKTLVELTKALAMIAAGAFVIWSVWALRH